jgi:hypothetical protein
MTTILDLSIAGAVLSAITATFAFYLPKLRRAGSVRWVLSVICSIAVFGGSWWGLAAAGVDAGVAAGLASVPFVIVLTLAGWWAGRSLPNDGRAIPDGMSVKELPGVGPAGLLDPRRGVVKFTGRERELAGLLDWCEADLLRGVRLITGPGGVGKTP